LKRVKKRRVLVHPLSDLAQEIIEEAMLADGGEYIFKGHSVGTALDDKALGHAARGYKNATGKVVRQGICEFLGMTPWTPHDLRRTCATLAGDLGYTDAEIAKCLDHRKDRGDDAAPTVTGVYVRSERINEKRELLDDVAAKRARSSASP